MNLHLIDPEVTSFEAERVGLAHALGHEPVDDHNREVCRLDRNRFDITPREVIALEQMRQAEVHRERMGHAVARVEARWVLAFAENREPPECECELVFDGRDEHRSIHEECALPTSS